MPSPLSAYPDTIPSTPRRAAGDHHHNNSNSNSSSNISSRSNTKPISPRNVTNHNTNDNTASLPAPALPPASPAPTPTEQQTRASKRRSPQGTAPIHPILTNCGSRAPWHPPRPAYRATPLERSPSRLSRTCRVLPNQNYRQPEIVQSNQPPPIFLVG